MTTSAMSSSGMRAADEVSHDLASDAVGRARRDRLSQALEADVE